MPEMSVCPACQGTAASDLFRAKDHLVSGREFLVRRCAICGMGWTVDPPAEEEAGKYYASDEYISHTDNKQSLADRIYHIARGFMLKRKGKLVESAVGKSAGIMIDFGSGTGYFAAFMGNCMHFVPGFIAMRQADRRADIPGRDDSPITSNNATSAAPVA